MAMEGANTEERPTKRLKTSAENEPPGVLSNSVDSGPSLTTSPQFNALSSSVAAVLEKEARVGIATFVGEHPTTITGIFKQRYTDFLVNEVLPDGTVLHLKNTTYQGQSQESKPEKVDSAPIASTERNGDAAKSTASDSANGTGSSDLPKISDQDHAQLVKYLGEDSVVEMLALYASITENPRKRSRDHPIVNAPFTSDRMVRTEIHQAIRRIFHSKIDSSTNKDGILVLSAANPNFRNNHGSRVGKLSWIERGGEHCHFTLYKEMKDTMESISFLAYLTKKNPRDFQIAGTKDRRAATVQRVSVWRVEAERLTALNRNPTMKNAMLGDFAYHTSGLQLGDLSGNEFTITVRDVRLLDGSNDAYVVQNSLKTALSSLHTNGFLNYYGLQRFGTFAIGSDVLGLQLLKGDFEGACNSILDYNDSALADDDSNVGREDRARAQAIKIFRETNSVKDALDVMPKRLSAETAVIRALGKDSGNHLGALMMLQRNMRQMYVHAYQSLIWNKAATERWKLYGSKVVEGDLVLVAEHKHKEAAAAAAAARDPSGNDAGVDPEGEVIIHASGNDRARSGGGVGSNDAFERARPLTAHEAASAQYTIFDIVLPLPGFDVLYPQNDSGDSFYREIMGRDGLDPHDMRRPQKDFSLSGSYRKVIGRISRDFDVQVRRYTQDEEQFVVTDRERLLMGKEMRDETRASKKTTVTTTTTTTSSSSTAAATTTTASPSEKGDESIEVVVGGGSENGTKSTHPQGQQPQPQEQQQHTTVATTTTAAAEAEEKTAAILKIQLGTSQYATMALREISRGGMAEYKPGFSGGR